MISKEDLQVTERGRKILSLPIGIVIYRKAPKSVKIATEIIQNYKPPLIITVGDIVTWNFIKEGLSVNIAILDGKTLRKRKINYQYTLSRFKFKISCFNPPKHIMFNALDSVRKAVKKALEGVPVVILVKGEEDLLGIPALIFSPLNSVVVYGYWKGGLGIIFSNNYLKNSFSNFIKKEFFKV